MARGVRRVWPECQCEEVPLADGGEGFVEAVRTACGGDLVELEVTGPHGKQVRAEYLLTSLDNGSKHAVMEMSAAAGLHLIDSGKGSPSGHTTKGVGEMILHATDSGAERIVVGLGGSATNDAGAGLATALGYRFLDESDRPMEPLPKHFHKVQRMEGPEERGWPPVLAACDVRSLLLGPNGASRGFAPQKGADEEEVEMLEQALDHFSKVAEKTFQKQGRDHPGAGAAGGLGFGLKIFAGAELVTGFDFLAGLVGLSDRLASVDLVLTGEGKLDRFSLEGKVPGGVARLAREAGRPVLGFAGWIVDEERLEEKFDALCPVVDQVMEFEQAVANGPELVEQAVARSCRLLALGKKMSRA